MAVETMHPRIKELGTKLQALIDTPPERPTQKDRDEMMDLRRDIKGLSEELDGELTDDDLQSIGYLVAQSAIEANKQLDFYESNGNQWEPS